MIAMGFWFNAILRVGPLMSSNNGSEQAIDHFRWYSTAMATFGTLILFFTALAQIE
jgi:putative copper export protein